MILRTDMRDTRERARSLRFEPTATNKATNVQKAIEQVTTASPVVVTTPVAHGDSPYTVLSTDTYLAVDSSGGAVTINLQAAAARSGAPLTIKDTGGQAASHNITLTPNGVQTIDTETSYLIDSNFGGVRLVPVSGGYTVDP